MQTLVLDQSYMPVGRVEWRRAVTLLFQGKVEVIDEYEDKEIKSVHFSMKVPSVVRFLRALRGKKKAIKFSRHNVHLRDKGTCQYCGNKVQGNNWTYDHVIPKSRQGPTSWTNVVVCCSPCNQYKKNRTPEEAGMKLLNKPVRPSKLPDSLRFGITWREGMPPSWKDFLATYHYWNGELESD